MGMMRAALLLPLLLGGSAARGDATFTVDPDAGNNTFSAVFEAAIGERITAVGAGVGCTLRVDETARTGRATCSVPLTSIRVDNDDTKSDHFRQWATNKTTDPRACVLALDVPGVRLADPVEPMKPVSFETRGRFTICGRTRDDGGTEKITGTLVYLPAGSHGDGRTLRIRGRIEGFDRERYHIGPKWTDGWLARVQELAPVVATDGTIEVSLFATEPVAR
jgi:hypothetical protein